MNSDPREEQHGDPHRHSFEAFDSEPEIKTALEQANICDERSQIVLASAIRAAFEAGRATGRREALGEACKALCEKCEKGWQIVRSSELLCHLAPDYSPGGSCGAIRIQHLASPVERPGEQGMGGECAPAVSDPFADPSGGSSASPTTAEELANDAKLSEEALANPTRISYEQVAKDLGLRDKSASPTPGSPR